VVIEGLVVRNDGAGLGFSVDPGAEAWKAKRLGAVAEGQWARLIWNAKRAGAETKWLVEFVLNAGRFAEPPSGQVFLGVPQSELDLRHDFLRNAYR
jgi:hypothetical protein